jgi:hypothetical protein
MENKTKVMSQVSKELVLELQVIIKEEYKKEVTIEEASEIANGLVGYFNTLAKIHHGTIFVHKEEASSVNMKAIPKEKTDSGT